MVKQFAYVVKTERTVRPAYSGAQGHSHPTRACSQDSQPSAPCIVLCQLHHSAFRMTTVALSSDQTVRAQPGSLGSTAERKTKPQPGMSHGTFASTTGCEPGCPIIASAPPSPVLIKATVLEGVETEENKSSHRKHKCPGFFFGSSPLPNCYLG